MVLREFINEKVTFMTNRARFVATTKESFGVQLLLLLEMYGGIDMAEAHKVLYPKQRGLYNPDIEEAWASEIGHGALRLIGRAQVTDKPGWRNRD